MNKDYITLNEEAIKHFTEKIIKVVPNNVSELNNDENYVNQEEMKQGTTYPQTMLQEVLFDIGGFQKGDILTGMTFSQIIEKLLCGKVTLQHPTFLGVMDYADIDDITYDMLDSAEYVDKDIVVKPITTYTHSRGSMFNKTHVIAFPIALGNIIEVSDNARISLSGAYHWKTVTFNVAEEDVEYVVGCNKQPLMFANGTTVKWIIN